MRNVSAGSCTETQNTHFMVNNFFLKSFRLCGKIWQSRTNHRWSYNNAHARCVLDKYTQNHVI